jgi:Predicted transcriptional regulator with C-terminal CBS domains
MRFSHEDVRNRRKTRKLTLAQASKLAGIPQRSWQDYEAGSVDPQWRRAVAMLEVVGVGVELGEWGDCGAPA